METPAEYEAKNILTSDSEIFRLVRAELKRARGKYTKPRNPKQALNPIKAEIYECQNELEYDEPDYVAARTELIHVIVTAIRAIDSIDCEIARREQALPRGRK